MESLVRKVEVKDDCADTYIAYPKDLHPTITLPAPTDYQSLSEIELVIGTLNLRGDALRSGHIKIFLREDTQYSQLITHVMAIESST